PSLLLAGDGLLGALAGTGVGLRPLTADGQTAAPPQAFVAADLDLPADVGVDLAPQVTLDAVVRLDVVAELDHVLVGQVLDAEVRADARGLQQLLGAGTADAVDVGQRDLHPLFAGEVDASNSCHVSSSSVVSRSAPQPPRVAVRAPAWSGGEPGPCDPAGVGRASSLVRPAARAGSAQPWRCLWRRFSQITMTRP